MSSSLKAIGAVLRGESAHHLGRVLRAEPGQIYELSDGARVWVARTERVGREEIEFSLLERLPVHAAPVRVTLLLAVVKFDRFEWAIEKATELGVDEVVPLAADRSEKGLLAATAKRAQRWKRILMESAQQARRLRVPVLRECAKSCDAFRGGLAQAGTQVQLLLSERGGAKRNAGVARTCGSGRRRGRSSRTSPLHLARRAAGPTLNLSRPDQQAMRKQLWASTFYARKLLCAPRLPRCNMHLARFDPQATRCEPRNLETRGECRERSAGK